MKRQLLTLSLLVTCSAGALETSQPPLNDARKSPEAVTEATASQNETRPSVGPEAQEKDPNHDFSSSLLIMPKLHRSGDIKYDIFSEEVKKNQSDSFGLGVNLFMKPKKWYGSRGVAGFDFQASRKVTFINSLGKAEDFDATAAAVYLQLGYQLWKFYGDIGINYPFDFRKEWSTYKVSVTPGARINIGAEIKGGLSLEYFYSFSSYGLSEKVSVGSSKDIRIFQNSSGLVLKLSGK